MSAQIKNDGRKFEALVASLTNCLHDKAAITPNDKLVDKHTGRKRQIDISIRVSDGPSKFLAIVEARDRSRKVGVTYLEQVKSKRDAVGADKAIIVSNKGFTGTAIPKAKAYNIELLSLSEALRQNWSQTFSLFQGFTVLSFGSSLKIYFIDENRRIINPHESVQQSLITDGHNAEIILDQFGNPKMTASQLISPMFRNTEISDAVNQDPKAKHSVQIDFNVPESEKMYFRNEMGKLQELNQFVVVGQVWREIKTYEPSVKQYTDVKTGEVIAEVLGTNDPDFSFEMIAESPTQIDKERRIFLRRKK